MDESSDAPTPSAAVLVELLDESPRSRRSLGAAFKGWARSESDFRVLFTPEVFIAVDLADRRGYLYDDGWSVECWIGTGESDFLELLEREFAWSDEQAFAISGRGATLQGLIELAYERGSPIAEVRHLM